jgi:hypothetical protein
MIGDRLENDSAFSTKKRQLPIEIRRETRYNTCRDTLNRKEKSESMEATDPDKGVALRRAF